MVISIASILFLKLFHIIACTLSWKSAPVLAAIIHFGIKVTLFNGDIHLQRGFSAFKINQPAFFFGNRVGISFKILCLCIIRSVSVSIWVNKHHERIFRKSDFSSSCILSFKYNFFLVIPVNIPLGKEFIDIVFVIAEANILCQPCVNIINVREDSFCWSATLAVFFVFFLLYHICCVMGRFNQCFLKTVIKIVTEVEIFQDLGFLFH